MPNCTCGTFGRCPGPARYARAFRLLTPVDPYKKARPYSSNPEEKMLRTKYFVAASCVVAVARRQIKEEVRGNADELEPDEQEHELIGRGYQHRARQSS